jgi:hypothetical protein
MNNAYHFEIDAQMERTTWILEDMLGIYVGDKQRTWE